MSSLKNARIKAYIEQNFTDLIDLSSIHEKNRPIALLTRGIASLAVMSFTACSLQDAADSIVDGGGDKGIDAIYYDKYTNTIYFIQSKWSNDGNKTLDEAAAHKLADGVDKLLDLDFEGFNERVRKKKDILEKITNDANVKIILCPAYNSNNSISDSVKEILIKYMGKINDGEDIIRLEVAEQSKIYKVVVKDHGPVNADVMIKNWIKISNSKTAYYGLVAVSELADLFEKHQKSLFDPNIRDFKGDTDVNNMIVESLTATPEIFCYLNNGITLIANEVKKKPLGGASHESGVFECKGLAVVNGAQTVGACSRVYKQNKEKADLGYVIAKIIETTHQDSDLAISITKAANTQNKIERKDFVAIDPFQKLLQEDLGLLGITYRYKTGEEALRGEDSIDLTYLTQALVAATGDIALVATAKREIGKIWDDIDKAPYKTLFNPTNNAHYVKNILDIFHKIQELIKVCVSGDKRKKQYSIYGNVFIASECLKQVNKEKIKYDTYDLKATLHQLEAIVPSTFIHIYTKTEQEYPGTPLVYLFRNVKKLKMIENKPVQKN